MLQLAKSAPRHYLDVMFQLQLSPQLSDAQRRLFA
jgi:hypothetical protein